MSYMKFKEFVALKEAPFNGINPMQQQQAAQNPANKLQVLNNLQNVMKAPVPPGINPSLYQQKIKAAMQVAKTTGSPSASAAMDTANAQVKASQLN